MEILEKMLIRSYIEIVDSISSSFTSFILFSKFSLKFSKF